MNLKIRGIFGYYPPSQTLAFVRSHGGAVDLGDEVEPPLAVVKSDEFIILPMNFALLVSEEVEVPKGKVGFVTLRSTVARLGLMAPPTVVKPCFRGEVVLEVFNASPMPVKVSKGMELFELVLADSEEPCYEGRYQGQKGLTPPKLPI